MPAVLMYYQVYLYQMIPITNQYFPLCSSKLCLNLHMHHRINMKPRNMTIFLQKFAENINSLFKTATDNKLNYFMQQSSFWNMNGFSASREVSCTIWKVQTIFISICYLSLNLSHDKCPCNHSMLPQVADGGTASRYVQQLPIRWTSSCR
jgi:hypothetical protein